MQRGIRPSRRRTTLRLLAPALIMLGVCVFCWGLRYKLSFYSEPHSMKHRMAEAKLLLTDRSTVPAVALRKAADSVPPLAVAVVPPTLFLLVGMSFLSGCEWALKPERVHTASGRFRGGPAFIRPPPRS